MSSFDDATDGPELNGYEQDEGEIVEFENISYEKSDDGIALIMIDRPEKLNALNLATIDELTDAFADARSDDAVRVVILTGGGGKAFIAGADIAEMAQLQPDEAREFALRGQALTLLIENLGSMKASTCSGARPTYWRGFMTWPRLMA